MAIDLSVYDKIGQNSLATLIPQRQAMSQQLAAGNIDLQTKKNAYVTQIMSAASASGDPNEYMKGKQFLQSQGIDASNYSDDPVVGKQQAEAARMALISPLGMLNSQIQLQRNGIQAAGVNGTNAPATLGAPSTLSTPVPVIRGDSLPSTQIIADAMNSTPDAAIPPAAVTPSAAPPPVSANMLATTIPIRAPSPDDKKYAGFNPKTQSEMFKNDMDVYNNRPDVIQAKKTAESLGTDEGKNNADAKNAFNVMIGNLPAVVSRTNGLIKYAPDASSGLGVTSGSTEEGFFPAFANSWMGSQKIADANSQVTKYAAQGAFPEIASALKGSDMRGNRFLEQLMSNGLSINAQSPADTKVLAAQTNLGNYIQGLKSLASRLRAQGDSGVPSDQQIDDMFVKAGATLPETFNAPQGGAPEQENKVIDGVTYTKINGKWHK